MFLFSELIKLSVKKKGGRNETKTKRTVSAAKDQLVHFIIVLVTLFFGSATFSRWVFHDLSRRRPTTLNDFVSFYLLKKN